MPQWLSSCKTPNLTDLQIIDVEPLFQPDRSVCAAYSETILKYSVRQCRILQRAMTLQRTSFGAVKLIFVQRIMYMYVCHYYLCLLEKRSMDDSTRSRISYSLKYLLKYELNS